MNRRSVVAVANEQVPIATVCRLLGVEVPEEMVRSPKLHCPFEQLNHSDGGMDKAMRIYDESNTAYCFSCAISYTPVTMWCLAMDTNDRRAVAAQLLDQIGYRPVDLAAAWEHAQTYQPQPDRSQLAEALTTFCRRTQPGWRIRQFDAPVAAMLSRCLDLLDLVGDAEDAVLWLSRCKGVMDATISGSKPT